MSEEAAVETTEKQKVRQPLTKQEKVRRILIIVLSSVAALVIIFGLIFGSMYSIEKNEFSSFDSVMDDYYYRPTVVYASRPGCPNCTKVKGGLSQLKDNYKNQVNFYHIDVWDKGEGEEIWENGWRGSGSFRSKCGVSNSGIDGVPAIVCIYARKNKDDDIQWGYASYAVNRTNAETVLKQIEKMLDSAKKLGIG